MDKITRIIKKVYYKYEDARNPWMQGKASKSLEEMINEIASETKTKILAEIEKQIFNKTLECSFEQTEYCKGFKERERELKQNFDKLKENKE